MAAAAGTARRRDADLAGGFDVLLQGLEDRLDLRGAEEEGRVRAGGGVRPQGAEVVEVVVLAVSRRERGLLAVL